LQPLHAVKDPNALAQVIKELGHEIACEILARRVCARNVADPALLGSDLHHLRECAATWSELYSLKKKYINSETRWRSHRFVMRAFARAALMLPFLNLKNGYRAA
jgi:hypothetical protein